MTLRDASPPADVTVHIYEKCNTVPRVVLHDICDVSTIAHDMACASSMSTGKMTLESIHLPNVGRESHTYLEHIIRTRTRSHFTRDSKCQDEEGHAHENDTGDEITVFLQGNMTDHVPDGHASIATFVAWMVADASQSRFGESSNHACHTKFGSFNACPEMRAAMFAGVGDSGHTFGSWFSQLVTPWVWRSPSEGPSWWQNGVFAIRTCRFFSATEEEDAAHEAYYHMLRSHVSWHVNPEQGHFFERSWHHIFPPLSQSVTSVKS